MSISRFNFAKTWFHKMSPLTLCLTSLNMTFTYPSIHHPSVYIRPSIQLSPIHSSTEGLSQWLGHQSLQRPQPGPPRWQRNPRIGHVPFPPSPPSPRPPLELRAGQSAWGGRWGLPGEAEGGCQALSRGGLSCRPRATPASDRFGDGLAVAWLLGCGHLCPGHPCKPEREDVPPVLF